MAILKVKAVLLQYPFLFTITTETLQAVAIVLLLIKQKIHEKNFLNSRYYFVFIYQFCL